MKAAGYFCAAIALFCGVSFINVPPVMADTKPSGAALYHAMLMQDIPKVKLLLSQGADVNHKENGRPILVWAAQSANVDLVKVLLENKANVNLPDEGIGHSPLMRAVETQNLDIVKTLLQAKADPNAKAANEESILAMAVRAGNPEIVQALIDSGANAKVITKDDETTVYLATMENQEASPEIIKILAKAGADVNHPNIIHTPLTYASEQGNALLVSAILEAGADANRKAPGGRTPLEYADKKEVVDALLKAKANPNVETQSGTTPLIRAIENGDIGVVESLLNAGAELGKADERGSSPLQVATSYNKPEIVELLKKRGATQ